MIVNNIKDTEIKPSPLHGKGLFATRLIPKDTLLCILQGQVMSYIDYQELVHLNKHNVTYFIEKYKVNEQLVAAMAFRTKYSFINHHETPNIYSALHGSELHVYALRDILKGEELVDAYNLDKHIDVLGGFEPNHTKQPIKTKTINT